MSTSKKPSYDYERTPERNSVKAPTRGVTREMWEHYDSTTRDLTSADIPAIAERKGWNERLARSHYYWHKRFHAKAAPAAKKLNGKAAKADGKADGKGKAAAAAKKAVVRKPATVARKPAAKRPKAPAAKRPKAPTAAATTA